MTACLPLACAGNGYVCSFVLDGAAVGGSSEDSKTGGDMCMAREVEEWNQKHLYFAESDIIR